LPARTPGARWTPNRFRDALWNFTSTLEKASKQMDGRQLRKLFQEFNQRYFGGRLPAYRIRVVDHISWLGTEGRCLKKRKLIQVQRAIPEDRAASLLLHEMTHAATNGDHGMPWKREMIRLREAGAPLDGPDATVSLDDWDGVRVSQAHFRGAVQDVLGDCPECTLSQAIRHFISTYGGPETISLFLKRYPWARDVYRRLKRERTEYAAKVRLWQQESVSVHAHGATVKSG